MSNYWVWVRAGTILAIGLVVIAALIRTVPVVGWVEDGYCYTGLYPFQTAYNNNVAFEIEGVTVEGESRCRILATSNAGDWSGNTHTLDMTDSIVDADGVLLSGTYTWYQPNDLTSQIPLTGVGLLVGLLGILAFLGLAAKEITTEGGAE